MTRGRALYDEAWLREQAAKRVRWQTNTDATAVVVDTDQPPDAPSDPLGDRTAYSLGRGAVGRPIRERDVQAACLQLLQTHPAVAFAYRANTGGVERTNADGTTRYIAFGFPGCADIIGMLKGGRTFVVECKHPVTGRVTDDQRAFLTNVARSGGFAIVARDVDDVVRALRAA